MIKIPEIISPFQATESLNRDRAFVKDLSLDALLEKVPFSKGAGTKALAKEVLLEEGSSPQIVLFRQDALEELIFDDAKREGAKKVANGLVSMVRDYELYEEGKNYSCAFSNGIKVLNGLKKVVSYSDFLKSAKSEALKRLSAHFTEIAGRQFYDSLFRWLDNFNNAKSLNLTVSLEEYSQGCNPVSRIAFSKKKAGKRRSLIGSYREDAISYMLLNAFKKDFEMAFPQVIETGKIAAPLDFYVSFAQYFANLVKEGFDITRPKILSKGERRITLKDVRNPILSGQTGQVIVPNNIVHNPNQNMFIITGPNNGGKTTYVKTLGLVQLMGQQGLYVPAGQAEISFVDGIHTHFVSPDDITKGEGRYRNELRRMKEIFSNASPYSLIILDEPCGGTSPSEGEKQSLVILDGMHRIGAATYFTTHLHKTAREVSRGRYHAAKNLHVGCKDDGQLRYTYKMEEGLAGKSYGAEVARDIGLSASDITNIVQTKAEKEGYSDLLRR